MSNGAVLPGQQFNPSDVVIFPFTEQVCDYETMLTFLGNPNTEIIPINKDQWKVTIFDTTGIDALLDGLAFSYPGYVSLGSLDLPLELTGVTVVTHSQLGAGVNSHPDTQQGFIFNGSGSGSINPRSTSQGSAAILFDIQPIIRYRNQGKVKSTSYYFYMPDSYTDTQLIAKMLALFTATILILPVFKPEPVIVSLKGIRGSVSAEASSQVSASDSPNNYSASYEWGGGTSEDLDVTLTTKELPPTIHGVITFSPTSLAKTIVAAAVADTTTVTTTHLAISPITNHVTTGLVLTGSLTPTATTATTPSSIPTSGLYIVSIDNSPYLFDRVRVAVEVIDFANI